MPNTAVCLARQTRILSGQQAPGINPWYCPALQPGFEDHRFLLLGRRRKIRAQVSPGSVVHDTYSCCIQS
jgi:hypothetical protein